MCTKGKEKVQAVNNTKERKEVLSLARRRDESLEGRSV